MIIYITDLKSKKKKKNVNEENISFTIHKKNYHFYKFILYDKLNFKEWYETSLSWQLCNMSQLAK